MIKKIKDAIIDGPIDFACCVINLDPDKLNFFGRIVVWILSTFIVLTVGAAFYIPALIILAFVFIATVIAWAMQFLFIKKEERVTFGIYWRRQWR